MADGMSGLLGIPDGQARTRALHKFMKEDVAHYVPPNLRKMMGGLAQMNPVNDIYQAGGDLRDGNYVGAATNTASALVPVAGAVAAKPMAAGLAQTSDDATRAIADSLLGFVPGRSAAATDAVVERANQRGPVPTMYSNPIGKADGPQDFDFLGYRTVEEGSDPTAPSRVWVDGEPTDEILDGVSVTDKNFKHAEAMHNLAPRARGFEQYFGEETYLVGGNKATVGEDPGELVITNPVVIELVRKFGAAGAAVMLGMSTNQLEAQINSQPHSRAPKTEETGMGGLLGVPKQGQTQRRSDLERYLKK